MLGVDEFIDLRRDTGALKARVPTLELSVIHELNPLFFRCALQWESSA